MPFRAYAGMFSPSDLDLLQRIYAATLPPDASEADREAHATVIMRLFRNGIVKEDVLLREVKKASQQGNNRRRRRFGGP